MNPIRVLHWEPDNLGSAAALEALQSTGYEYLRVETQGQFVAALESREVDAVLCPAALFRRPAAEALAYLRGERAAIPLICFTTRAKGEELLADGDADSEPDLKLRVWDVISRKDAARLPRAIAQAVENAALKRKLDLTLAELGQTRELLLKNQNSITIGRLLGSIAHEINNPLEAVTNLLFLAQSHSGGEEDARTWIAMAEKEVQRVAEITRQMLSFHRESRVAEEVQATEAMEAVLSLYEVRLRERGIEVVRQYSGDAALTVHRGELRQALANLVGNAIDAMPEGGRLTVRIRRQAIREPIRSETAGESALGGASASDGAFRVVITIADSGTGMSRAVARRVGDIFFTTKGQSGTGLGMWVTRQLIDKHHGSLRVYSSPRLGRSGTVFRISFLGRPAVKPNMAADLAGNISGIASGSLQRGAERWLTAGGAGTGGRDNGHEARHDNGHSGGSGNPNGKLTSRSA